MRVRDFILVEDNEDHAILVKKTLRANRILNQLQVYSDAESALAYLSNTEAELPQVVLLDINLPGMDGIELLERMRADERLKVVPVVILSTSDAERDRRRAYAAGTNSFLTKPIDFDKFRQLIKDTGLYWGVWNTPPQGN